MVFKYVLNFEKKYNCVFCNHLKKQAEFSMSVLPYGQNLYLLPSWILWFYQPQLMPLHILIPVW